MEDLDTTKPASEENEETPETPETPQVDPSEVEALKQTVEELRSAREEDARRWEEFQASQQSPQTTEQPKSWDEVRAWSREEARRIVEEEQAKAAQFAKEEAESKAKIDKHLDDQLAEMEKNGTIPKVKDENDPTDPGKLMRQQIFGFAAHAQTTNLKQVASTLKELEDAGKSYDPKTNKFVNRKSQPAGEYAPIGSSSARSGSGNRRTMKYEDLHNARDLDDVLAKAGFQQ